MYDVYRRWEVVQWLGAAPAVAQSADSMHATVDRWADRADGPFGVWAAALRGSGEPVGTVLLAQMPDAAGEPTEDVEVGWHLHPDHWGHGYATEAARGALVRAWAASVPVVPVVPVVHAVIRPGNVRSVAVAGRLGMALVERTDRWYGVELDAFSVVRPDPP
jgi:RimJ/RimL family protein N-acetyltransferase